MSSATSATTGVATGSQPDYSRFEIPSGKPYEEYTYVERRAYLAGEIATAGHPDLISRRGEADRFDVSHQQISKDIKAIAEHVVERGHDRQRRALECQTVVRKSIRGLLEAEEWEKAARLQLDYEGWLVEFYDQEALHARLDALEDQLAEGDR